MDEGYGAYTNADPIFFDVLHAAQGDPRPFDLATCELPDGWGRVEQDDWLVMVPPDDVELPLQGWKIHASSCLDNAESVLGKVWAYCAPRGIKFKFLRSHAALISRVSKYAPRGYSGKLVTIYPADDTVCERILNELGELLDGEPSPYILSDLRWGKGPLYVRYGAFASRFCVAPNGQIVGAIADDTGTLVPDRRGPVFHLPPWVKLPGFLQPHLDARNSVKLTDISYTVERALHFSNGGGIYVGRRKLDDRQVVLKEARPHSGLDARGQDAVARVEREYKIMREFAGIPGVPEAYELFDIGEHRFLAMEYVDGRPLSREIAHRFPLIKLDTTPDDLAAYTAWAMGIYDQTERAVKAIHERGYVYGDLHLWNVLVREDDTIGLLDFEVAAPVSEMTRPGLANQGFASPSSTTGFDIDLYALACLKLALFLPLMNIVWLDRTKARHFADVISAHFPVPEDFLAQAVEVIAPEPGPIPALGDWEQARMSLTKAIVGSATPHRDDRLFPGDPRQFSTGGGISLGYGAAGVLYALSATGAGRFPEYEEWLLQRARKPATGTPPGLYDGLHGVAFVLEHLGYQKEALNLVDMVLSENWTTLGQDLHSGLAGVGLNLLHLAHRTGEPRLREAGLEAARLVAERLGNEDSVPEISGGDNPLAGLVRGASGPALLLMRAYDETGDEAFLEKAATALRMDLKRCVVRSDGIMEVNEGWRTMPYFETGSVGIGLALEDYLTRREDEQFRTAADQIGLAAQSTMYALPNLFSGRAGILLYLAATKRPGIEKQVRNLDWHAVPFKDGLAFPGNGLLRLSMDLATGTAGVLLALGAALDDKTPALIGAGQVNP
ncbi:class III lanthionine synthetase LanKC [Allorhizocola rhizosphaerae]|uniref:class III lanthionine synthetase LanKC n=1 Tax=Allorhizocola rhizosphaerae TaxID=1872709 RepID=UPI000E3DCBC4|nr:class III lanthionine synthetase LanKC [Allorhizocola rhizosphaerae]